MDAVLAARIEVLDARLAEITDDWSPAALASSLSAEDMVVTDAILRARLPIQIFTLDTGRLHADTLDVIGAVRSRYGHEIDVFRPDPRAVADYVTSFGRDAFYRSVELRKQCCALRKVEPLARALAGKRAWLTGQRRGQASTRVRLPLRESDAVHGIEKFNPLADWSEDDAWRYIRALEVPYNRLHDQGYRSIGCAPCTRPVTPDEDIRAGRWWWEGQGSRECGLHVAPDGRRVRAKELAT